MTDFLLTEDGGYLLTEAGGRIVIRAARKKPMVTLEFSNEEGLPPAGNWTIIGAYRVVISGETSDMPTAALVGTRYASADAALSAVLAAHADWAGEWPAEGARVPIVEGYQAIVPALASDVEGTKRLICLAQLNATYAEFLAAIYQPVTEVIAGPAPTDITYDASYVATWGHGIASTNPTDDFDTLAAGIAVPSWTRDDSSAHRVPPWYLIAEVTA